MQNLYRSVSKEGGYKYSIETREGSVLNREIHDEYHHHPTTTTPEEQELVRESSSSFTEERTWPATWFYSGYGQLIIAAYVGFANIGIWNALNTIGGFGTGDESISRVAMTTFDGVAVIGGFIAGSLVNWYGYRWVCFVSSVATSMFVSIVFIMFYYTVPLSKLWIALAAVLVGVVDGCMFAAIGSIAINYAMDNQKSIFLAIYSTMLNIGGLLGGFISLMMSLDLSSTKPTEGTSTGLSKPNYTALLGIMMTGMPASLMLCKPERVRRTDKSLVPVVGEMSLKDEVDGVLMGLKDHYVWLLLPIFMCTIWHEVVLFNYFNIAYFNVRSRAMNAVYYYLGRTLISFPFQVVCDWPKTVPNRMVAGIAFTGCLCMIAGTTALMTIFDAYKVRSSGLLLDFTDAHSTFLAICFFTYGAMESVATSFSLWIIGNLPTQDTAMMNRYFGWSRVGGAFGGFTPWLLDSINRIPHDVQWFISASLWICALTCLTLLQFELRNKVEEGTPLVATAEDVEIVGDV